jgi:RNase P subunit RPR2
MVQKTININVNNLAVIECLICNTMYFQPVTKLRYIPAMVSATGKPDLVSETVFKCVNCGAIYTVPELTKVK